MSKKYVLTGSDSLPFPHQRHFLQDIARLLQLASSSISLLTLPQTDGETDNLPQGEERSEQFVLEVSEYFERLDVSLSPYFRLATCTDVYTAILRTRTSNLPFVLPSPTYDSHVYHPPPSTPHPKDSDHELLESVFPR